MNAEDIVNKKKSVITIGRLLWEKDLASGLNGNISRRVDGETILLTSHGSCLGLLLEKDVLLMKLSGELLEEGNVSSEQLLHTEIYRNYPEVTSVVHTHTIYTNAYFLENKTLTPRIFESKMLLGEITSVEQLTPAVTDAGPVMEALKHNNITVLRHHGVVAKGQDLFDCFLLIQGLEDAVKVATLSRLYKGEGPANPRPPVTEERVCKENRYKLFSQGQMEAIVKLVNEDKQMKDLGEATRMTMDLGVKLNETGVTYSFRFDKGRIIEVGNDENAEFLITAPEAVWRAVFNREVDPFVATTQKKMNLRGDFAKISKWYAPCSRIFEIWGDVPVE